MLLRVSVVEADLWDRVGSRVLKIFTIATCNRHALFYVHRMQVRSGKWATHNPDTVSPHRWPEANTAKK